ncbi:MAG: glycerol kinase GlpK [Candidatus Limnocylindrales bacterium]
MAARRYVLALDQGTSSSRAVLFDEGARPVAMAQREVACSFPRPGWVEQDPQALVTSLIEAAREVLARAGVPAAALAVAGIANQRETTIAWDGAGRPLAPAIVWQDRRTAERCAALRAAGHEADVRVRTGLLLDPYFSATKMAWLLDAIPDGRRRAATGDMRLGTVDAWLAWRLTGGRSFATDASNASRTLLLDLATRVWSPEQLARFGIPEAALPEVRPTDGDFGVLEPDILGAEVPLRAMAGDQQAALFGQTCFQPGEAKNTYGTGCFLLATTGPTPPLPPAGLLATLGWLRAAGPSYALEGSVFTAGAAVRWLRDNLGVIATAMEVEALAASVPDSGGVTFVPAFAGLGAPYWDADARGAIFGLTAGTTTAHLARATLEAIAHQTADLVETLEAGSAVHLPSLRADGGAAANDLLLQLQADLLGRPVERAAVGETTALGAALLAGRAVGFWPDDEALRGLIGSTRRVFEPRASADWRAAMRARWAASVARTRSTLA